MKHPALVLVFFFVAACSLEQRANTCVDGQSTACACTDGHQGAQLCTDGTFGACVCDTANPNGNDEDLAAPEDEPHDMKKPKDMTKAPVDMASASQSSDLTLTESGDLATPPAVADMTTLPSPQDLKSTDLAAAPKRVFVTKTAYVASAVLTACQTSADAAVLGGTFVPWLSTAAMDAKDRIAGNGPWRFVKGTTNVFANAAQLGTTPSIVFRYDEYGDLLPFTGVNAELEVWTGTTNGGGGTLHNCNSWLSATAVYEGTLGWAGTTADWTDSGKKASCASPRKAHVYCFEQ